MHWLHTSATQYPAQLGLSDKGHALKGLVVFNNLDLEPLDLLNGQALGCYQPSPEILIVCLYLQKETEVGKHRLDFIIEMPSLNIVLY